VHRGDWRRPPKARYVRVETIDLISLLVLNKPEFPAARFSKRVLERFCNTNPEGYKTQEE